MSTKLHLYFTKAQWKQKIITFFVKRICFTLEKKSLIQALERGKNTEEFDLKKASWLTNRMHRLFGSSRNKTVSPLLYRHSERIKTRQRCSCGIGHEKRQLRWIPDRLTPFLFGEDEKGEGIRIPPSPPTLTPWNIFKIKVVNKKCAIKYERAWCQ